MKRSLQKKKWKRMMHTSPQWYLGYDLAILPWLITYLRQIRICAYCNLRYILLFPFIAYHIALINFLNIFFVQAFSRNNQNWQCFGPLRAIGRKRTHDKNVPRVNALMAWWVFGANVASTSSHFPQCTEKVALYSTGRGKGGESFCPRFLRIIGGRRAELSTWTTS